MPDPSSLLAICPDAASLEAVRKPFDAACGYPKPSISSADGQPCKDGWSTDHALEPEVILAADGSVAAHVHPVLDATAAKIADVVAKLAARNPVAAEAAAKGLGIAASAVAKIRVVTREVADGEIAAGKVLAEKTEPTKIEEAKKP